MYKCIKCFLFAAFCFSFSTINARHFEIGRKNFHRRSCIDSAKLACSCSLNELEIDKKILLKYIRNRQSAFTVNQLHCLKTDLIIHASHISLDSIYFRKVKNKSVAYLPGFCEGVYDKKGNEILLEMIFLNSAINSSRSTLHKYTIKYSLETRKIYKIDFKFIDDSTSMTD